MPMPFQSAYGATKAYVTNGAISDWAVVTAVTDPDAVMR